MALGVGKVVDLVRNHPAAVVGTAAAIGAYRAHPWRKLAGLGAFVGLPPLPWAEDSVVADMFLGDPNAIAKINRAKITRAIDILASPYSDPGIPYGSSGPMGPSGSMVFGMWNDRIK